MKIYRGYYLRTLPLSGRTEVYTPKGELVDTLPSPEKAEKVIDDWMYAR